MIASIVKKFLTEEKIEQIRRFKNLQKSSIHALRDSKIIPTIKVQIGSSSFDISYISEIPMLQWKKIVSDYELLATPSQKEEAITALAQSISREPHFLQVLSQPYLQSIISNKELYACLYGSALYVNGRTADAFAVFKELAEAFPSVFTFLFAYRAAVLLDDNERTAIELVKKGLQKFPNDQVLQLCLASSYYRSFQLDPANQVIENINPDFREKIKGFDIAGTPAKNLKLFEGELRSAIADKLVERPK